MHYTLAYLLFLLLFTAWACTWVTSLDSIMHTYSFAESAWNDKNISALTTPRATVDNTDGSLFVIFQSLPQLLPHLVKVICFHANNLLSERLLYLVVILP